MRLGFTPEELNNIQAKPLLMLKAPASWLSVMLAEWLQWAPVMLMYHPPMWSLKKQA